MRAVVFYGKWVGRWKISASRTSRVKTILCIFRFSPSFLCMLFVRSFARSFVRSFVRPSVHSFVRSYNRPIALCRADNDGRVCSRSLRTFDRSYINSHYGSLAFHFIRSFVRCVLFYSFRRCALCLATFFLSCSSPFLSSFCLLLLFFVRTALSTLGLACVI